MVILITNDDGYQADGIKVLAKWLRELGRVVSVAPEWQQSATSHSLTLYRPLRLKKVSGNAYAVSGTPTDAVMIAVNCILKRKPDILISGINDGPNMGDDITYSGTVAAAMEGAILGIPSIAVSLASTNSANNQISKYLSKASRFTAKLVKAVMKNGIPKGALLNVNVPAKPGVDIRRYRITRLGKREYRNVITEKIDPRGEPYFWIGGHYVITDKGPDTDYGAIRNGFISVTPLDVDLTNQELYLTLKKWKI